MDDPHPEEAAVERRPIVYRAIGRAENDFDEPTAPPKIRAVESRIVLDPSLVEGLQGLEPGRRIVVVFCFHRSHGFDLLQHPQGDRSRPRRGVFALRSPRRPNPIGVTVVDLVAVELNKYCFEASVTCTISHLLEEVKLTHYLLMHLFPLCPGR